MADEGHSTHEMVRNLHSRFDRLDERMDALHADHLLLREDVNKLKTEVRDDIAHLDKHEAEACLKESAILTQLSILTKRFDHHAEQEEKDRRWVLGIVIATMLSSIGTLLVMVLGG
jgi:hypothetical protein